MSENEAILVGVDEISRFMRVSPTNLRRLRKKYTDIPIHQESPTAQLWADKETLSSWQRQLCAGKTLMGIPHQN